MTEQIESAEYFLRRITEATIRRYPRYCEEVIARVREAYKKARLNPSIETFDRISKIEKKLLKDI